MPVIPEVSSPIPTSTVGSSSESSITPTQTLETAARPLPAPSEPAAPEVVRPEDRRGWNPNRWWVRQKVSLGYRGWRMRRGKCIKLGTLMWDYKTQGFNTKREALKFIRTMGCDCCARPPPPARIREARYYRSGYGDYIMLLRG